MKPETKIFIAGKNGLLGHALTHKLQSQGFKNLLLPSSKDLDLTSQAAIHDFFKEFKPEIVFLAAGRVGGIIANQKYRADFLHINMSIQDNVFECAKLFGARAVVFYGSSCTYPKFSPQPIKEEYLLTGEIESTSEAYAAAKIAGIIGCKSYNLQHQSCKYIALVPNSMYGPFDNFDLENSHVLSSLIAKLHDAKVNQRKEITLWGSGTPRREFIYSEDVANASIFAVNNVEHMENTHYNIGTGIDYSIKEIAEIIARVVGYDGIINWDTSKPDGTPRKLLDSSKFLSFGWEPEVNLEDGLLKTYEWYQQLITTRKK